MLILSPLRERGENGRFGQRPAPRLILVFNPHPQTACKKHTRLRADGERCSTRLAILPNKDALFCEEWEVKAGEKRHAGPMRRVAPHEPGGFS
jgi:hypothetical protein